MSWLWLLLPIFALLVLALGMALMRMAAKDAEINRIMAEKYGDEDGEDEPSDSRADRIRRSVEFAERKCKR